jgi:hypothetical protein
LLPNRDGKKKDQEDHEGDKSDLQGFQHPANVVNIIFGSDSTKRAQKLTLLEILSVEPAIQRPLRHKEVVISFSREDQWTSFSELEKFLLVLDPVVAGSQLT